MMIGRAAFSAVYFTVLSFIYANSQYGKNLKATSSQFQLSR